MAPDFPITDRTRLKRRPQRGAYDRETVYAILDAGVICHIGYVVDGQPLVTPTAYWRWEDRIYWHGSAASRMLAAVDGAPVCVTVSHLDGLVLARSAFHHSINYRSVMLFGRAELIEDADHKRTALNAFIDRLFPGRSQACRESSDKELAAISLIGLIIEEASAKVRSTGVVDDEEDYALPVWAGVIGTRMTIGATAADTRLQVEPAPPAHAAVYAENSALDAVLTNCAIAAGRLGK
jgi:hypothetical protein